MQANFQNFNIWVSNLEFEERSKSCTYTFFLPRGGGAVEIKLRNSKRCISTFFQPQNPEIVLVFILIAAIFMIYKM